MRWRELVAILLLTPSLSFAQTAGAPEGEMVAAIAPGREALEIEARQAALRMLEADLARKLGELLAAREKLDKALTAEESPEADLSTLIGFYQAMKPKNSARLLEKLPAGLASDVLSAMSPRSAGKILNVMKPDRAVKISKLMAGNPR